MEFIKLVITFNKRYVYDDASNEEMTILGHFLATDIGCAQGSFFKEWGISDEWNDETHGNLTMLKKDGNYILLKDLFSEEEIPVVLKMTRKQYVQVITDWEEKVCQLKPKEVIIKYENDRFIMETQSL
jgi:hypothetical protein